MKSLIKMWQVGLFAAIVGGGSLIAYSQADPPVTPMPLHTLNAQASMVEMLGHADELSTHVQDDLRQIKHLQGQARKLKDVIKLTCVNDKAVAIKAEANIFDDSLRTLRAMVPEAAARAAAYEQVTTSAVSVHQSRVAAEGCVGENTLTNEASNSFAHPAFPDDPTLGDPYGNGVEPPAYASPYN